ncbi:hypothetical protein JOE21_000462 [Desmospora profundinema]|uniref:Uncharacterized protein n=1 Tax=Desmospora profundinema TaxID=1571184 RepID=A0ABU1IKH4_9BACL|nr:hypothetical protein [Desmospora profundinema]
MQGLRCYFFSLFLKQVYRVEYIYTMDFSH